MEAAGTIAIATATETHRIPAMTSAATRAPLPTIRLRLLASLHDMERGGPRVVVETAEVSASDRVVTGLQRVEAVRGPVAPEYGHPSDGQGPSGKLGCNRGTK